MKLVGKPAPSIASASPHFWDIYSTSNREEEEEEEEPGKFNWQS
jgi:hypothetical protein